MIIDIPIVCFKYVVIALKMYQKIDLIKYLHIQVIICVMCNK